MAFCTQCGTNLADTNKFCPKCGTRSVGIISNNNVVNNDTVNNSETPIQPVQPPPLQPMENQEDNAILLEYKIVSRNFRVTDVNGKVIFSDKAFTGGSVAKEIAIKALLGPLGSTDFYIKIMIFKSKIVFIKLNMFYKPTEYIIEIFFNEIISIKSQELNLLVVKTTDIIIGTNSRGSFTFEVPKKHKDETINLLHHFTGKTIDMI